MAEVARAAGVSPMTVSRVINRGSNVLPDTRAKVEAAIAKLGYVPNPAARSLAGGKVCRIALLHSNPSSAYLSEFLMGGLAQAGDDNAQLVVEYWETGVVGDDLVRKLVAQRVDGVLVPPPLCDERPLLDKLQAAGLSFAQIATGRPLPDALAVTIDDEAAAYAVTSELLAQGHTVVGFIAGNPNQTVSRLRRIGYERALREAGISIDLSRIVDGDFTYRSGLEGAEKLLSESVRPTAIFASNDDMAAAAVAVAHRHGLDVPGDLSVCGFDDTAMATTIWPELTTVRQPIAEMARTATRLLISSIRAAPSEASSPKQVRLDFELIRRHSDGPPRH